MLLFCIGLLVACDNKDANENGNENTITLSGTVGYPQDGLITLEKIEGNQPVTIDTIALKEDYTFSKAVNVDHPGYFRLNFYDKQYVPLILHQDDVSVSVDGNQRNGFSRVSGSRDHDFIEKAQSIFTKFQSSEDIQVLNQAFRDARASRDEEKMDSLRVVYLDRHEKVKEDLIAMIDSMGASLGVVEVLRNGRLLDKDKHYDVYKRYAALLKKEIPESPVAQDFINEVDQMGKLAIGQVAPEIALPNPEGDTVKLSSLRGNYVLVDFWAKWCKPCRMENPNIVKMYQKYNDEGFEVFGVSLDKRKEDWLQAIEQDNLTWTHVSDLKYWNSAAAQTYNITSIPFAVLLDPEGVIIAKNLRGKALEDKLAEIFSEEG